MRTDPAGNVFGRREGNVSPCPAILFGSHLDTVPRGGHYDGTLGVLERSKCCAPSESSEPKPATRWPMVVWCDEEGAHFGNGLFGSRAATGGIHGLRRCSTESGKTGSASTNGSSVTSSIPGRWSAPSWTRAGCGRSSNSTSSRAATWNGRAAGSRSWRASWGIHRFEVNVGGFQNHAGTTPMAERKDAMLTAAHLIVAVHEEIRALPGEQVGNVGQLAVSPDAANVVPGSVRFPIELRDLKDEVVDDIIERIGTRGARLAEATDCTVGIHRTLRSPPPTWIPGSGRCSTESPGKRVTSRSRSPAAPATTPKTPPGTASPRR